jgi:hypothetical protein
MGFKETIDPDWKGLKSWKTYHYYMKKMSLEFVSILSAGLGLFLLSTIQVSAQPLVMNTPTNISINPEEPLPANGTVSISTEGVTDTDMNVIPPEGVTVIISNDTVTVTNQPGDIAMADEDEETEENGANGGGDGGGDEDDDGDDDEGGDGGGPAVPF